MTLIEQKQRNLVDSVELGIMLGKSRDYVLRLCKQGKLPKPVKPVRRNMRWLASDIETWLSLGCPSQAVFENWKRTNGRDNELLEVEFLRKSAVRDHL